MVGDTPEELGSGLHLGLNLIINVLKQARYHWIPSQGSRDMENIPRQQLLVRFPLHFDTGGGGVEGFISPTGGEMDPPMWGAILILVQYPTNLVVNVSPNFTRVQGSSSF